MFACNASVDVYNYEEAEEEVPDRSIRMLSGIQSVRSLIISDDTLEGLIEDTEFILREDDGNFEIIPCCLRSHLKVISMMVIHGQEGPIHLLKNFLHSAVIQRLVLHNPNNASNYMGKREEFENQLVMLPRILENCVMEVLDWPL